MSKDSRPFTRSGVWGSDVQDRLGVHRSNSFYFDYNGSGAWDAGVTSTRFGSPGDIALVGDWNGDGRDQIGVWREGVFYLDYDGDGRWDGSVDRWFRFGTATDTPIVGNWAGPVGGQALHAAGVPTPKAGTAAGPSLDDDALAPIVFAAIADWTTLLDLGAGQRNPLYDVRFVIADLPGTMLGLTQRNTVYLDARAAGHGWFLDPTPAIDEEFEPVGSGGELRAVDSALAERMDLLTVVSHELGHVLGLADLDPLADGLMGASLQPGQRYRPGAAEREAYFAALV